MNAATKLRLANIFTTLVMIIAIIQTFFTTPPFTPHAVYVWGAVLAYLAMALTTWKQYLSPEISNTGGQITLWIAVAATITGVLDLLNVFDWSADTEKWIKWGVTVVVAIINVLSKQLFPSQLQKDNVKQLKTQ